MPNREDMISFTQTLRWAAAAAFFAFFVPSIGWTQSAPQKTLRFIPQADLRSIDPIWTTAYVTRNFGYLVFDTLFALDKDFKPQPQMVDRWTASDDKLTYSFVLRDGLKWHDGQPVRAADCIASIERWGKRDTLGQKLMEAVGRDASGRRQDFYNKAEIAVPADPRCARQALEQCAVHDAGAAGQDRRLPADPRGDRLRPVQVRQRRVGARPQGGLCQERRLRAARGGAELRLRRQGGKSRSCRVAVHS